MKKVLFLLMVSLLLAGVVSAASLHGEFEGFPIVKVESNGQELAVQDVPAVNLNGRTMVPIYMLRELGATVAWDQERQTASVYIEEMNPTENQNTIQINQRDFKQFAVDHEVMRFLTSVMDQFSLIQNSVYLLENSMTDEQYNSALNNVDRIGSGLSEWVDTLETLSVNKSDIMEMRDIVSQIEKIRQSLSKGDTLVFQDLMVTRQSFNRLFVKYDNYLIEFSQDYRSQ